MALTVGGEMLTARLHPNEEMRVDGGKLVSVKRVDFAAEQGAALETAAGRIVI